MSSQTTRNMIKSWKTCISVVHVSIRLGISNFTSQTLEMVKQQCCRNGSIKMPLRIICVCFRNYGLFSSVNQLDKYMGLTAV